MMGQDEGGREGGVDYRWQTSEIDVGTYVTELERVLRAGQDPERCREALKILERWQFDLMLDAASRRRAAKLIHEFGPPCIGSRRLLFAARHPRPLPPPS